MPTFGDYWSPSRASAEFGLYRAGAALRRMRCDCGSLFWWAPPLDWDRSGCLVFPVGGAFWGRPPRCEQGGCEELGWPCGFRLAPLRDREEEEAGVPQPHLRIILYYIGARYISPYAKDRPCAGTMRSGGRSGSGTWPNLGCRGVA
ncbi:hypothetical protein NDU88_002824 [Pleurodeles waltl]|uniref:Uncharacterized protein n=1 Tax=Pleurodeles waltl TaxID=8319 RepID=A0AAV7MWT6_PLEWA|nr:hypothetical protein NDU88_002824 [Pleurodeles waltl]